MSEISSAIDLLYILSCAFSGEKAELNRLKKMDYDKIFTFAKKHSLLSASYIAIEPYIDELPPCEHFDEWKKVVKENVFRQIQYDMERERIYSFFDKIGCWHMSLKGVVLKDMYVNPAMREFADNDILFDKNYAKQLRDFMVKNGYSARVEIGKDDIYRKEPFFNFEMHRALVDECNDEVFVNYYKNVKDRLVKSSENEYEYEYHFTDEDFYIYMIYHYSHHYKGGGIGLKVLTDVYVYTKAKGDSLNWNYIEKEFEKLGMYDFERTLRSISLKLLSFPQTTTLSNEENEMLCYMVSAGAYGTKVNHIENELKADFGENPTYAQKLKYFFRRVFLTPAQMKSKYPKIRKHPVLLPFGYFYRIFFCGIPGFKRLYKEVKIVWKK